MRIRKLLIIGASAALAGAGTPALASDAATSALPVMGKSFSGGHARPGMNSGWHGGRPQMGGVHRWGQRQNGRWYAGWRAPGGWNGYQRPIRGYVLPRYWINPGFYIGNYGAYGLPTPGYGYGWSRYYDDAVMTDRYGRVSDYRSDIDWSRYDGGYDDDRYDDGRRYDDEATYRRPDSGVGGAAIGAVVGGVAGNRIAGRGNRTAGTLIGAGVGAVAGYAIDKAEDAPRRAPPPRGAGSDYDRDYGHADDGVTYDGAYQGRWVGTWHGQDGTSYSGEYEGRYEGDVRGTSRGVDYDATPPRDGGPHWSHGPIVTHGGGGYISGGYYYPAPTVTTVTIEPATTTTTTYVTERVTYRKPVVRKRVRRACACK